MSDDEAEWDSAHRFAEGPGSEDVAKTVPTWQLREISSHPSYHGAINKEKAEHKLSKKDRTCFLTRYSEARDQYTLSVHTKGKETVFQNFDIIITNKDGCVAYEISGTEEKFTSLVKLLDFYKEYPLNHYIHSIGEELVNNKRGSSTSRVTEPVIAESSTEAGPDSKPRKSFPCLLSKDSEGKIVFVSKESGKTFSESSEFMEFCENKTAEADEKDKVFQGEEETSHSKIYYQKLISKEGLNKGIPVEVLTAMNKHPSFHGSITRVDATTLLFRKGRKCYLTRYSDYHKTCVISALRTSEDGELLQHFKLDITTRDKVTKYEIAGTQKEFDSISALLEFYQKTPINHRIDTLGDCLVCSFMIQHRRISEKRQSSIDLVRIHSRSLTQVAEESAEQISLENPDTPSSAGSKDDHIVKAVPDWKIKEISNHPSFHGIMDVEEAETMLRETLLREQDREYCHLTRYSETREDHTLSVMKRKEDEYVFLNFDIIIEQDDDHTTMYEIFGSQKKFDSIAKLLDFYKANQLTHSIDSIGESARAPSAQQIDSKGNKNGIEGENELRSDHDSIDANKSSCADSRAKKRKFDSQNFRKLMSREGQESAVPQWALKAMNSHPSFHGSITRTEAAKMLIESGKNSYLTRYSDYRNFCVISVLRVSVNGELLQHLELKVPQDSSQHVYKVAGTDKEFENVYKMLEFYQKDCLGECLQAQPTNLDTAATEDQNEVITEEEEDMSHPTIPNLRCITYTDSDGIVHDFNLLELISDRWWKAGMLLSVRLDKCQDQVGNHGKSCKRVFSKWIKNNGHRDYPLTWAGLHKLLVDMGRSSVAEKLYKVLKYKETKEIKYVDTMYTLVL